MDKLHFDLILVIKMYENKLEINDAALDNNI